MTSNRRFNNPFDEVASRLKGYFSSSPSASSGAQPTGGGGVALIDRNSAQVTRGSREILELYHHSPWLRATVSKIAQHFSSVPWELTRVSSSKSHSLARKLKRYPNQFRRSLIKDALYNQQVEEIDTHPVLNLLDKPNYRFGGNQLRSLTQKYLDLVGEFFWVIERNTKGMPVELWPIPPTWISKVPTTADEPFEFKYQQVHKHIAQRDVIWFCDDNVVNPYGRGRGTALSLADELDADEYAAQLIKACFENRGIFDVIVGVEGAREDQLERVRAQYQNRHQGWRKAGTAMFHSGKADVKVISQSFAEMQLLQLREWERDTVISVYGVPPELLGVLGKSNRATILESREIMASEVLIPRLDYFRNVLNTQLLPQFGDPSLVLEYEDPTPGNEEFRLRAMQAFPWAATVREIRELQQLEDRGERDDFAMVPAGLYPLRGDMGSIERPQQNTGNEPQDGEVVEEVKPLESKHTTVQHVKEIKANSKLEAALEAVSPAPFVDKVLPLWRAEIEKTIDSDMNELSSLNDSSNGSSKAFNKADPDILDIIATHLRDFSLNRVKGLIDATTKDRLRATLAEGILEEEGIIDLRKRVMEVFDVSKARAQVIARTEVIRSSNFATNVALQQSGLVQEKEWIVTIDDRTRDSHQTMHAQRAPIDGEFVLESGVNAGAKSYFPGNFNIAAEDIQCFPGDTVVSGDVIAVMRTHYTGKLVCLQTASGNKLTLTPNHPVLTATGYVPAQQLTKGQQIVARSKQVNSRFSPEFTGDDRPTTIEQLFNSFSSIGVFATVGLSSKDLHGDAVSTQGNIDVVSLNGELLSNILKTRGFKNTNELGFVSADPSQSLVMSSSSSDLTLQRINTMTRSFPRSSTLPFNLSAVTLQGLPLQVLSFGSTSQAYISLDESRLQNPTRDSSLYAELLERSPGFVTLDEIVEVGNIDFSGHLYDLQTLEGWMLAQDIFTSNCRCTHWAVIPEARNVEGMHHTDVQVSRWKAFDERATKWEEKAIPLINQAFDDQMEAVLRALE